MDYKKTLAPNNTITRDLITLAEETGNIYETVRIIGKRSNQISVEIKHELENKLHEFSSYTDSLEEIFENREQIEISRYFERLPKSSLIAIQQYIDKDVYYRNPLKDKDKSEEI